MPVEDVLFVLGKHPDTPSAGDVVITRLLMDLARESYRVRAVALDNSRQGSPDLDVIAKPRVDVARAAIDSVRRRRSMIHTRFDLPSLQRYLLDHDSAGRIVAEHSYMAESCVAASAAMAKDRLIVNTHVSEANVLRDTHRGNPAAWVEAARTRADERRVASTARSVAVFDEGELDWYSDVPRKLWLSITMPPLARIKVEENGPTLAFVGNLSWKPNVDALRPLLAAWPRISSGIASARLLLIGKGSVEAARGTSAVGLGFVDDLPGALSGCRALIAPIAVGGGVRVKLLEAASNGLPAVATPTAVGSLEKILPFTASHGDEEVVERARRLLLEPRYAREESVNLFDANADRWASGAPKRLAEELIRA